MTVTFYSYKGGVGRSMALINVAEILADVGYRVVLCDFDLEAPGLERYACDSRQDAHKFEAYEGVIDLLTDYKNSLSSATELAEESLPNLRSPLDVAHSLPRPRAPGSLELLTAGKRDNPDRPYARQVQEFDWVDFYERWAGGSYVEFFRKNLDRFADPHGSPDRADVVLIDSRTGVTEHGGVCTHHLADAVVALSAANDLNVDGTTWMTERLARPELARLRNGRPLWVFPVASRIEQSAEKEQLVAFRNRFAELFTGIVPAAAGHTEFIARTEIPYVPFYSFEERVVARENPERRHRELYSAYLNLSHAIVRLGMENKLIGPPRRADWLPSLDSEPANQRATSSLPRILLAHENWLNSAGERGERAVLAGRDLTNADLSGRTMRQADFRAARLTRANLEGCDLTEADLTEAMLDRASLRNATLARARLIRASLTAADLTSADLAECDVTDATFSGAVLTGVDLRSIIGITRTQIDQASTDRTTVLPYRVPDAATTLPPEASDVQIRYAASLCHDYADSPVASALHRALQRFAQPWYRPPRRIYRDTALFRGDSRETALQPMLQSESLIVLLSSHSSPWVAHQVRFWLERKPKGRIVVADLSSDRSSDRLGLLASVPSGPEPKFVDLSWVQSQDQLNLAHPLFRQAITEILAVVLNVGEAELIGEELRVQSFRRRMLIIAATLMVVLGSFAAVGLWQSRLAHAQVRQLVSEMERLSVELRSQRMQLQRSEAQVKAYRDALDKVATPNTPRRQTR